MDCIDSVKRYFKHMILPQIWEITDSDELLVVIGGSVSYGFNDEYSDVDVYIIWDLPRELWIEKLRQYLFTHQAIDEFRVQIIPLILTNSMYSPLSHLLHEEFENLKNFDMKLLYDILHYIPVYDPKDIISRSKAYINHLDEGFWQEKCIQHCAEHIDILEAFYSSIKRENTITGSMYYGDALKGLLQIAYLCAQKPYPTAKWIWNDLQKVDNDVFIALNKILKNEFPCTCSDLENNIHAVTEVITNKLKEKGTVPSYIIDDLLSP